MAVIRESSGLNSRIASVPWLKLIVRLPSRTICAFEQRDLTRMLLQNPRDSVKGNVELKTGSRTEKDISKKKNQLKLIIKKKTYFHIQDQTLI